MSFHTQSPTQDTDPTLQNEGSQSHLERRSNWLRSLRPHPHEQQQQQRFLRPQPDQGFHQPILNSQPKSCKKQPASYLTQNNSKPVGSTWEPNAGGLLCSFSTYAATSPSRKSSPRGLTEHTRNLKDFSLRSSSNTALTPYLFRCTQGIES